MRLTKRDEYGNADIIGVDSADLQLNLSYEEFNRVTEALNKLAAYEDIGPTPEQLKEIDQLYSEQAAKLQHYEELKQEGKLIELPFKAGDTVYINAWFGKAVPHVIEKIGDLHVYTYDKKNPGRNHADFYMDMFGKAVFLTEQEAEEQLKELEEKNESV